MQALQRPCGCPATQYAKQADLPLHSRTVSLKAPCQNVCLRTTSRNAQQRLHASKGSADQATEAPKAVWPDPEPVDPEKEVGFRYDAANLRWVRDNKYSEKYWNTTVKPLIGAEYTVWPAVHTALTRAGLKSISPEEAYELQQQGAVLVDARVQRHYDEEHATGAVCLPLFRPVQGKTWLDTIKRVAVGSMAMEATERDPEFQAKALELLDKNQKVIVYCGLGGTLHVGVKPWAPGRRAYNDPDRAFGRESRSLKACHELILAGFTDVIHLEGGLGQWRHEGFPTEETESSN
ncbi:hypothetical protein WJX72_012000 [[Myrmecia] bisecta]|uniref:Rhodanese domain-containing protein n=1 Tax=[Myrmecia] bisecta TaxID=41462 RepID=A0AAW1P1W0_9CHLO